MNFARFKFALKMVSSTTLLEQQQCYIPTSSAGFDSLFGGGIPLGALTEVCGMPGLGKTQIW